MKVGLALLTALSLLVAAGPAHAQRLAFFQDDVGAVAPYGIATANPGGGDQRLVGPTCQEGEPAPCPANPAWSRDGARIAFDLGGRIGTMNANGSEARTFAVPGVRDLRRPSWSPDGARLVLDGVDTRGTRNLFVVTLQSDQLRRLTYVGGAQPAWSRNEEVAFVRRGDIHLIRGSGGEARRVTFKGGSQPAWASDSVRLAFVRSRNVHRVRADGSGLRRLTGKLGYEPAWSQDGVRVLFHRVDAGTNREIFSVNLSAGDLRLETAGEEGRRRAVHSVDQQPLR